MGLRTQKVDLSTILKDKRLRFGLNTIKLNKEIFSSVKSNSNKTLKLNKIFTLKSGFAFKSEDYVGSGIPLLRIGDLEKDLDKLEMVFLPEEYIEEYKSYILIENDIVISLTGDGRSKVDKISGKFDSKILLNQRVGVLRAKESLNNIDYFYFLIRYSYIFKDQFKYFSNGKTQLNISPEDLLQISLPIIEDSKIDTLLLELSSLESEIEELKKQIEPEVKIINKVFTLWFGWELNTFESLKEVHIMTKSLSDFSNNIDIRFSYKFHNKAGSFVTGILKAHTFKRIKHYLSEEISLGKSISPPDYYEDGEHYYISMADIKHWHLEIEDAKTVSKSYFDENVNKRVSINDIILARSGEGTIGKVAFIDNDNVNGVYADFTMRIRLKNYNPLFAYYYFRTYFFQHLIYTHKKGLGNNTNIFPSQIREFPIPEISLEEQAEIINSIKVELGKHQEINQLIEDKKKNIATIIQEALI